MRPPFDPNRQTDVDVWICEECNKKFSLLVSEFGEPTFCPNCSSTEIRKVQMPDRDPYPDRRPEFWM